MLGVPRAATTKAASVLECYVLAKKHFVEILQSREEIIREISEVVVARKSSLDTTREGFMHSKERVRRDSAVNEMIAKVRGFFDINLHNQ